MQKQIVATKWGGVLFWSRRAVGVGLGAFWTSRGIMSTLLGNAVGTGEDRKVVGGWRLAVEGSEGEGAAGRGETRGERCST
jgi:hypothetical protein